MPATRPPVPRTASPFCLVISRWSLSLAVCSSISLPFAAIADNALFDAPFYAWEVAIEIKRSLVGDLNEDGRPDVVVLTGQQPGQGPVKVLLQNPDGTLASPVDYLPDTVNVANCALADVNLDGHLDLLATGGEHYGFSVSLGAGDGTFSYHATHLIGSYLEGIAVGDLDLDGLPDVVLTEPASNNLIIYTGTGTGYFEWHVAGGVIPTISNPTAVAIGNVTDNCCPPPPPDIIVASNTGEIAGLHSAPSLSLSPLLTTSGSKSGVGLAPLTNDDYLDVIAANYVTGGFTMWPAQGSGSGFDPYYHSGPTGALDISTEDVNGDGFEDVTMAGGFGTIAVYPGMFGGVAFGPRLDSRCSSGGRFVSIADMDLDGTPDAVVADYNGLVEIAYGNGDGTFGSYAAGPTLTSPGGMISADFNADGHADMAVTHPNEELVTICLGDDMGGFSTSSIPSGSGTYSIIAVDLNQDGDLDIVTGNILSEDISVLLGDGTGGFQNHVDYLLDPQGIGTGLASGDFDHDGHIDLAVATMGFVNVFHGAGGGLFDQQTFYMAGECPTNVAAADLDDDGWLDLVVSGDCEVDVMVLLGEPDGSFTYDAVWPMPTHPVAMRLADLNADGDADLITTGLGIANVRLGLPGSSFGSRVTYEVGIAAVGIAADDWNLDGDQDLAVMNGTQHSTVTVLLGNGTGGLGSRRDYGVGVNSSAIVSEDVDSDADPDLVVLSVANNHFCILENIAEPVSGVPEIGSGGAGRLEQVRVWPNPALSSVKIGFQADQPTPVTIRIHDVSGSLVRELANGQVFKEGRNTLAWDGLSDKGSAAPAGVYFAHVSSSAGSVTRRIVLAP